MFKTILFPIDHSRESIEAVPTVLNLVNTYYSRLVILAVVETTTETDSTMTSAKAVEQLLGKVQTLFSQQGVTAAILEREGIPSFTICDVADEINADLIIMGSRGLGLTDQGASESVSAKVINLSPCPVLVVP